MVNRIAQMEKRLIRQHKLRGKGEALPASRRRRIPAARPVARSLARSISYTVPGPVPVIAQSKTMGCWATALAILISWRDAMSRSVESILDDIGATWGKVYRDNTGLFPSQEKRLFREANLQAQRGVNLSAEGWHDLLKRHGPVWVTTDEAPGKPGGMHARIVKGIHGDGTADGTTLELIDPNGGREYSETVAQFLPKYEAEVSETGRVRFQLIYLPERARVSGQQGLRRRVRPVAGRSRVMALMLPVDYAVPEPVPVLAQPSGMTCWATVFTMLYSWKRAQSIAIPDALSGVGKRWADKFAADQGIQASEKVDFLAEAGLVAEPPMNFSVEGWDQMLREYGPIWVTTDEAPGKPWAIHARIITAIRGDGTAKGTRFTIIDPSGGRKYEESVATFIPKYEEEVRRTGYTRIQIVHWPRDARFGTAKALAMGGQTAADSAAPGAAPASEQGLLKRAIEFFSGTFVRPEDYPATVDGLQGYLDATGVRHFSAVEMTRPNHPDVAAKHGYTNLLPQQDWWPRGAALALASDELRDLVGEPVRMRNWWRPASYNAAVGGAADSDHITAHGVDLDYRSANSRQTAENRLWELQEKEPWLKISLGLGNATTHLGLLSPRGKRHWYYDSYPENRRRGQQAEAQSSPGRIIGVSLSNQSFDIRYEVQLVPQSTGMSCWAAGAAMLVGWRDRISLDPSEIANGIGYWKQYRDGLHPEDTTMFRHWGLTVEPAQTYTVEGFKELLEIYGPLWVASAEPGPHIRVVTGISGDGTPDGTNLYINDPWERGMAAFRPGNRGSVYSETYREFVSKQGELGRREAKDFPNALYVAHLGESGRRRVADNLTLARSQGRQRTDPEEFARQYSVALALEGSVGKGGNNRPDDVILVKNRLRELGYDWLDANGTVDDETVRTIRLFQSIKSGSQTVGGDGRIDVGKDTHRWLEASNAPRWQRMPAGSAGEGFHNVEVVDQPDDNHDFGTDWLADTVKGAAAAYRDSYRSEHVGAALLTVNDASVPRGGDTPDHIGHETGLDCDLRLPRTDGTAPGNTTKDHSQYDRSAMRAMLQALKAQPLVSRVFFNDETLIGEGLCSKKKGHDDHVHFGISPPVRSS